MPPLERRVVRGGLRRWLYGAVIRGGQGWKGRKGTPISRTSRMKPRHELLCGTRRASHSLNRDNVQRDALLSQGPMGKASKVEEQGLYRDIRVPQEPTSLLGPDFVPGKTR